MEMPSAYSFLMMANSRENKRKNVLKTCQHLCFQIFPWVHCSFLFMQIKHTAAPAADGIFTHKLCTTYL